MKTILSIGLLLSFQISLFAQFGTIRGNVIDKDSGEPILFANIIVKGTQEGGTSDLEGQFEINITPGSYIIEISYLGYADFIQKEFEVKAGEVHILNAQIQEESALIQGVVVTAKKSRNTESAIMAIQRKSSNVCDGISSQSFRKTGDGDAGQAMKRITGVSIEGGKHVYVRGLGDRYTKTILNGLDIPGLDPDRNSVALDIFPTHILDNIMVYKSFTPDLPGDFSGGVVDITTKDFPEDRNFAISIGGSYAPLMHMNGNFLGYEGGKLDFLGMDDGSRSLPFSKNQQIPDISDSRQNTLIPELTSQLSQTMSAEKIGNSFDKTFSASFGNQKKWKHWTLGYLMAINYRNESNYQENAKFQEHLITNQVFELNRQSSGQIGRVNVFWNSLAGMSIKNGNHTISLQYLKLQNGLSTASKLTQKTYETNPATIIKDNLEYEERTVDNLMVYGKHNLLNGSLNIHWSLMPTRAKVDEPDIRVTGFEVVKDNIDDEVSFEIRPSVGAEVNRAWRNLYEENISGKIDVGYNYKFIGGKTSTVKIGGLSSFKSREFEVLNYLFRVQQQSSLELNGEANAIFYPQNIWDPTSNTGTYIRGNYEPANSFSAKQIITSAYILNDIKLTQKMKAIYGFRLEHVENFYSGQSNDGQRIYQNENVLDETDILPSLNLVYELLDNMNIRMSGSKTIARPSFKEKSLAQIQDRITGRTYLGNIDLEDTKIRNLDIRWEYYFGNSELVSFSSFYKTFKKPIELVAFDAVAPNTFQPKNGADTWLYGFEVEFRSKLSHINNTLKGFDIGLNTTIVRSTIQIENQVARPMVGQSPYLLNGIFGYTNNDLGLNALISYNIQGQRLSIVGIGSVPNVWEKEFHALNLKISKRFGIEKKWTASFSINNVLNQKNVLEYQYAGQENALFQETSSGRSFSFSLGWML